MSLNGNDGSNDEADTDRPPDIDWRHIFEAFMAAAGPRIQALADAQVRLGEDMKRELGAVGNALWHLSENVAGLATKLDVHRDETTNRVARLEGVTSAIVQHQEKVTRTTNEQTRVINQAHPEAADIAEITSVNRIIDAAVAAKLTQHDLTHAQTQLAEHKERERFWARWGVGIVVGGISTIVVSTIVGVLVYVLTHR